MCEIMVWLWEEVHLDSKIGDFLRLSAWDLRCMAQGGLVSSCLQGLWINWDVKFLLCVLPLTQGNNIVIHEGMFQLHPWF